MTTHRAIVVISLDLEEPEQLALAVQAIKPENIPHFAGKFQVAIDPLASKILSLLDE